MFLPKWCSNTSIFIHCSGFKV